MRELPLSQVRDPGRLEAVRASQLLDTPPEETFDRLTRLAVRLMGVPAAFFSVVDQQRDFYKSHCGFGEPLATARQLEGTTFCHYAIESDGPLVIPDTRADPVFRLVPTVESLGVAAYAGVPVRTSDGHTLGSFCAIDFQPRQWSESDIEVLTELAKSAEREIQLRQAVGAAEAAEASLRDVFRQAPAFIAVVRGPDHVIEMANDRYFNLVGRRDIVGKRVEDAHPEARDQGYIELLDRVLESGEPFIGHELPLHIVRTPGAEPEERYLTFVYHVLTEADGMRSGVFIHGIDVTDAVTARKSIEATTRALAESEARYRSLTDAVPVQVWTAETDGQLNYVSERTTDYFGVTAQELLGSGWGAFVHEDDVTLSLSLWSRALATGMPYEVEFRLRSGATGEYRWHLGRALPERDASGAIVGWVGSNTDVEGERRARSEAEAANRAKSEFLAVMSHELRTPLNAIGGYAELLEMGIRGAVSESQRSDLRRIQTSQRHLLGLINEVLNYAKLETGTVQFDITNVSIRETLSIAESLVAPQARAKGLTIVTSECPPDLMVLADPEKLRQILVNLFSNAVKFTDAGGRIETSCTEEEGWATISVSDTGIGVAADKLDAIFDPFVQVRADLTRPFEGTGLGLAISRDLAHGMNGDLTAESTIGVGSTFRLRIPVSEPAG